MFYMDDFKSNPPSDFILDITGDVCPMTFVKTKLLIERMNSGQSALIRLRGAEPLDNVPRALADLGHVILNLSREDPDGPKDGVHRLHIRKV